MVTVYMIIMALVQNVALLPRPSSPKHSNNHTEGVYTAVASECDPEMLYPMKGGPVLGFSKSGGNLVGDCSAKRMFEGAKL